MIYVKLLRRRTWKAGRGVPSPARALPPGVRVNELNPKQEKDRMNRTRGMAKLAMAVAGVVALAACNGGDVTAPAADVVAFGSGSSGGAALARVRCELRQGRRSRISVDGNDLSPAGASFSARVRSGANTATATAQAAVGDEVEFDFDSNPADIALGATAIARNFIQISAGPDVTGEILNAAGVVVATGAVDCRVR